jgi:hypothetical protein
MRTQLRILSAALIVLLGLAYTASAEAAVLTIVLVRSSLTNDADDAGLWQYEGGTVQNFTTGATIGHYLVTRRVTTSGVQADNTAAESISLFFSNATAGNVPNNITLEGAYSYNTGQFAGSVSAASSRYHVMIGSDANGTVGTASGTTNLAIDWPGVLNIP